MTRIILYAILAFVLFRIVRAVVNTVARSSSAPPRRPPKPPTQKQDFSNVQDAEFEDLTPKKPPDGNPSPR